MALPPHKSRLSSIGPALVPKEQHQGKPAIRLLRPVYIIGSRSSARIHLISSSVSKAHAILIRSNGRTYIRDLASRTKIYINGREKREADLEDGDLIKIGSFTFQYIAGPGEDMVDPEAMKIAPPAKLDVVGAEYPVPFEERVLLVGRRTTCDVALVEGSVSTSHAAIFEIDGERYVRDLGSRTGTFVNGVSTHQHQLSPGDVIRMGETEMRYVPNEVASAAVVDEHEAGAEIPSLLEAADHHETPAAEPEAVESAHQEEEALEPVAAEAPVEEEAVIPIDEPLAPVAEEEEEAAIPIDEPEPVAKAAQLEPLEVEPELEPLAVEEPLETAPAEEAPAEEPIAAAEEEADLAPLAVEESLAVEPVDEVSTEEEPAAQLQVEPPPLVPIEEELAPAVEAIEPEPAAEVEAPASHDEPLEIAPAAEEAVAEEEHLAPFEPELETEPVAEVEAPEPLAIEEEEPLSPVEADLETEEPLPVIEEEISPALEAPEPAEAEPPTPVEVADADVVEEELPPPLTASVAPLSLASTDVPESIASDEYDIEDTMGSAVLDLQMPAIPEAPVDAAEELPLDVAPPESVSSIESDAGVEVLDSTEPTPESALPESADELAMDALGSPDVPLEEAVAAAEGAQNLTDTSFDRAVREFAGNEIGEIVEPVAEAAPETSPLEPELVEPAAESVEAESEAPEAPLEISEPAPEVAEIEPEIAEVEPEFTEVEPAVAAEAEPELAEAPSEIPEPLPPIEVGTETEFEIPALEPAAEIEEPPPLPELTEEDLLAEIEPPAKMELPAPAEPEKMRPLRGPGSSSGESIAGIEFPVLDEPPKATEPVSEILKIRPPPPARKPPKAEPATPAAKPAADASQPERKAPPSPRPRIPWGANQDNFLGGGLPLNLADPFGGAAPQAPVPPVRKKASSPPIKSPLSNAPIGEKAVNDLIEEIDTVAAAAEHAAETASTIPAISANDLEAPAPDAASAPPPREAFATGFDGLAMPPVRELDVFSQMSPPRRDAKIGAPSDSMIADAVAEHPDHSTTGNGEQPQSTTVSRRRDIQNGQSTFVSRPNPEELSEEPGDPVDLRGTGSAGETGTRRPLVAFPADEYQDFDPDDERHKAFSRAKILVGTMILLLVLTGVGIYMFLGSNSTVEGSFTFKNLAKLNLRERSQKASQIQAELAKDEGRQHALGQLRADVPRGFLDDPIEYNRVINAAHFSEEKPDTMLIPVVGRDPEADKARVAAVLNALYEMNKTMSDDAANAHHDLDDLKKRIDAAQTKLTALNSEIQRLTLLGDSLPDTDKLKKLETENTTLNKAWQEAEKAVARAQAELDQLKAAPAGAAVLPGMVRVEDDEKVKAMQAQLDELQSKANAAKQASSDQFDSAKKQLDSALESFEQQVADAQGKVNGSPEITSYLQSAQQLQEQTRKLTTDLIKHQEQQFGSLMELKAQWDEQMQKRRVEQWQKDARLQELTERQALVTRQYNTAVGTGLAKEAADKKAELELTATMIKARQDLMPADSLYTSASNQLQKIIDETKRNIDQDRRSTEAQLHTLEERFTANPAIQKLPQEQKQIADNITKQLAAVNAARQQYNKAIDTAGTSDIDAQLKTQISSVQAGIESRRQQLADENLTQMKNSQTEQARLAAIDVKQTELTQRTDAAATAQKAFFDKNKEYQDALAKNQQAKLNGEELTRLRIQKPRDEQDLQLLVAQLENKTRQANDAVEPVKPIPNNDISTVLGNDRRLLYTLSSFGAILMVFVGLLYWTLHTASAGIPSAAMADEEALDDSDETPTDPDGKKGHGPEEDHEPATI